VTVKDEENTEGRDCVAEQEALREIMQRSMGINAEGEKTITEEKSKGGRNFPPGCGTGGE